MAVLVASLFAAEVLAQAQGLRMQTTLTPLTPAEQMRAPLFVFGDRIESRGDDEVDIIGRGELRRGQTVISGSRITYFTEQGEVEAAGGVRLRAMGDEVRGPRLRLRVEDQIGIMERPTFTLAPRARPQGAAGTLRGEAEAVRFQGEDRYVVADGRFTSCVPGDDSWYLSAREIDLDLATDAGVARGARLTFKGVTTPAFPRVSFPLSNERKTGFLPPTFGIQGKVGPELLIPFYWNIAPNRDATITPRYMGQRGLQVLTEARYLEPWYSGTARYEYLPNDQVVGQSRYGLAWLHNFNYQNRYFGTVNFNRVSDDNYFRDLSGRLSIATQIYLPQEGTLNYAVAPGWVATARVQRFQTLQDVNSPVTPPYDRAGQLLLTGNRPNERGFDLLFNGEAVNFEHPTLPTGQRLIAYPSASLPLVRPGGYVTPKLGLHMTRYALSRLDASTDPLVAGSGQGAPSRVLPIGSVDSGLFFERDVRLWGQSFANTLEPRLYYLYVPYRNQQNIPVFDTAAADFNYAQIFSENYFVGGDRISDANQLTFAVTSRLVRTDTGQETLRGLIGQRFHFADRRVNLSSGSQARTDRVSSLLLGLSGEVYHRVVAESTVQLDSQDFRPERFNTGVRYQPELGKVLNLGYRFTTAALNPNPPATGVVREIRQIDVSGQWPIGGRWYLVGRYNYSIPDRTATEALVGLEYNGGCWIVRTVGQRFATATNTTTNLFFVQLELNGFSRIGSNPLEPLRRNIPGYSMLGRTPGSRQPTDFALETD